ncbi:hypothetical protein LOC68_17255 [Blastopirellula sp. JC732]|uniref:Tetratricopeptide repeat protein n=1 Tax=Blastopirellula sediminis TaxID=2894196 RepID=A0A9X1MNY2_9BACT|nr:tetratricopeptide repeat protein [Blastopirellula sediminis]MCC9606558.1 hypothetical protein [Blastopirellula sediminis]MCC9630144.1 hypothetical protein [Blastopirellula sediminis]
MWPFTRTKPEPLTAEQLRDKLFAAVASGSKSKLKAACQQHKQQVAENLETFLRAPQEILEDDQALDHHMRCVITIAQCLAQQCGAPELINRMQRVDDDNPFVKWDRWFNDMPERLERLEYDALISEAEELAKETSKFRGPPARQYEAFFNGRLGELLFGSGRVAEAIEPFQTALKLCLDIGDGEGEIAYLRNLLEVHRYLDDGQAIATAERLLETERKYQQPTTHTERRLRLLRQGEPLCRVVCIHDDKEQELEEISTITDGSYRFEFRRNRIPLHKVMVLTSQANQLATDGQLADALEKYYAASEVDPYDPDPVYQSGMCLSEMGAYDQARQAYAEVERLAPGWFRSRTDYWLADGLEQGTISQDEFQLLRLLDDGGLPPEQGREVANRGIETYPDFAPLYLFAGNFAEDHEQAIAAYRKGLELVSEPDLESRLLCALGGVLPSSSPERKEIVKRAVALDGSLVAIASAKLIGLQL